MQGVRNRQHPDVRVDSQLTTEVEAVLSTYAEAWSARDLRRVAELWDPRETHPTYIAEELADVLVEHEQIVEHLVRTEQRLDLSLVTLHELQVREIAPNVALATFVCRWGFEWVSYSRVSALFRRREGRWRFIHYMEAPFQMEEGSDEG